MARKLFSMALALVVVLGIGALSAQAQTSPVQIVMGEWGDSEREYNLSVLTKELLADMNVELVSQKYPSDSDFWNNLPAQIAAGTAPDFIRCTNEMYLQYINNGLFTDLTPYIEDGTITCLDKIMEVPKHIWEIKGGVYGIPVTQTPASFIINMDLWNKAGLTEEDFPETWSDVLESCKVFKEKLGMPGLCFNTQEFHFTQYALSFGGGWGFGETIDTPANAAALQYIIDAYKEGYVVTPKELGANYDGTVVIAGQAAMSTGGTWVYGDQQETAPDLALKFLPIPHAEGVEASGTIHTDALVMLKNGENEAMTAKTINYIANSKTVQDKMLSVGYVLSMQDRYAEFSEINPQFASLLDRIELSSGFAYPAESKKFADALIFEMEDVLFNGSDATGADIVTRLQEQFGGK